VVSPSIVEQVKDKIAKADSWGSVLAELHQKQPAI